MNTLMIATIINLYGPIAIAVITIIFGMLYIINEHKKKKLLKQILNELKK